MAFPTSTMVSVPSAASRGGGQRGRLPASRDHRDRVGAAQPREAARPGRQRRSADLECVASGLRRGRRGPARGLPRAGDRLADPHRPHLVGAGAGSGADAPARGHRDHHRDLPALPDARRVVGPWQYRQDQPAAAESGRSRGAVACHGRGHVDIIGTDNIHRDATSKTRLVWDASPGCPGLETMLPVLLSDGHHARGIRCRGSRR